MEGKNKKAHDCRVSAIRLPRVKCAEMPLLWAFRMFYLLMQKRKFFQKPISLGNTRVVGIFWGFCTLVVYVCKMGLCPIPLYDSTAPTMCGLDSLDKRFVQKEKVMTLQQNATQAAGVWVGLVQKEK